MRRLTELARGTALAVLCVALGTALASLLACLALLVGALLTVLIVLGAAVVGAAAGIELACLMLDKEGPRDG